MSLPSPPGYKRTPAVNQASYENLLHADTKDGWLFSLDDSKSMSWGWVRREAIGRDALIPSPKSWPKATKVFKRLGYLSPRLLKQIQQCPGARESRGQAPCSLCKVQWPGLYTGGLPNQSAGKANYQMGHLGAKHHGTALIMIYT